MLAPWGGARIVATFVSVIVALIATGLVLFVITLAVNMVARWIIARRAEFSGAN